MAEKIIFSPIEQQIISRVCSEFGFTTEETECVKRIVEMIAQTNSTKARFKAIMTLTAKFSPTSNELMAHAVELIWSLIAELRTRQTITQIALAGLSASLN